MPKKPLADRTKNERVSAGLLLLHGRKTTRALRADVDDAVAVAAAHAPTGPDRHRTMVAVMGATGLLAAKAALSIARGRRLVREAANARVLHELRGLGVEVERLPRAAERYWEDELAAQAAAQSLANQWQGMATTAALTASRRDRSVAAALTRTKPAMASRAERTAQTEVARAYNDERREALREAAHRDPKVADVASRLMRQWSCLVDACDQCADHDGELTGLHESFKGGDEPGYAHPRCRCSDEIVLV